MHAVEHLCNLDPAGAWDRTVGSEPTHGRACICQCCYHGLCDLRGAADRHELLGSMVDFYVDLGRVMVGLLETQKSQHQRPCCPNASGFQYLVRCHAVREPRTQMRGNSNSGKVTLANASLNLLGLQDSRHIEVTAWHKHQPVGVDSQTTSTGGATVESMPHVSRQASQLAAESCVWCHCGGGTLHTGCRYTILRATRFR